MPIIIDLVLFAWFDLPFCSFVCCAVLSTFSLFKLLQETAQMSIGRKMNKVCSMHTAEHCAAMRMHVLQLHKNTDNQT